MNAFTAIPQQTPLPIVAEIQSLPVTRQLEIALGIVTGRALYRFDGDNLDRAEMYIKSLLSEAREQAWAEDRALHGAEVSA